MKIWIAAFVLTGLTGCAWHAQPPQEPDDDSVARRQQLLLQNDMLQAKLLITSGDLDSLELAEALLDRAATQDTSGEADFYKAVLLIREGPQPDEVVELLERAAERGHPHAIALLYMIYADPYLVSEADPVRAEYYRERYSELDVAKSGYPSFERACELVKRLLTPPPEIAAPAPETP